MPPGHNGWAEPDADPELRPYIDLLRLGEGRAGSTTSSEAMDLVRRDATREASGCASTPTCTVGVILSGGLDSSLTLLHVREFHPDCVAFTVGTKGSEDLAYARRLAADLGVRARGDRAAPAGHRGWPTCARRSGSPRLTEYGDIINAVVSVPLFRRVHDRGIKVVLTGDGSDELFGGYEMYRQVARSSRGACSCTRSATSCRTELQRVDRTSMGTASRPGCRSSTSALVELAMRMPDSS